MKLDMDIESVILGGDSARGQLVSILFLLPDEIVLLLWLMPYRTSSTRPASWTIRS